METTYDIGEKAEFSKTILETDIYLFAGITGDFNPLHINQEYSKNTIFGSRIAHGIIAVSLISTKLGMYLPRHGAVYLDQSVEFKKPVLHRRYNHGPCRNS